MWQTAIGLAGMVLGACSALQCSCWISRQLRKAPRNHHILHSWSCPFTLQVLAWAPVDCARVGLIWTGASLKQPQGPSLASPGPHEQLYEPVLLCQG